MRKSFHLRIHDLVHIVFRGGGVAFADCKSGSCSPATHTHKHQHFYTSVTSGHSYVAFVLHTALLFPTDKTTTTNTCGVLVRHEWNSVVKEFDADMAHLEPHLSIDEVENVSEPGTALVYRG